MTSKTSAKAYFELQESGQLTKMQQAVANLFRKHGPMTGRQVSSMIPGAWKRLASLQDAGIVTVQGTTKDYGTGKIVSIWAITNQPMLPKVIQKKVRYRNDPKALSHLYNSAFEAGVRAALDYCLPSIPKETMEKAVETLCEVQE